jgi:hypothetical protein
VLSSASRPGRAVGCSVRHGEAQGIIELCTGLRRRKGAVRAMPYPELIKAFLAYLISHTGRPDREKRARLLARIGLERLTLADLTYEALEGSHLRWGEILKLTRRGQAKASRELFGQDQAFASSVPVGVEHRSHPPLPVLEEYLNGRLEDRPLALDRASLEGLIGGETRDWSLSEVSLHLATCRRCAARVAELRAAELELARTPDLGGARAREKERVLLRRRRAYQLLAPVGVALLPCLYQPGLLPAQLLVLPACDPARPEPELERGEPGGV